MKKIKWKNEYFLYIGMFFLLLLVHHSIFTRHLLTADVLLNNDVYRGYAWEISLGRFGLYVIGILKGFHSYPFVDTFVSSILIVLITACLIRLFDIQNKISKMAVILMMVLSPIISATLLFHYCSIAYFLAFFCGVLSVLIYYEAKKPIIKYVLPIILIVISLSMYQAYFSLIVTIFVLYQIKLLLDQKINYKQSGIYLLLFVGGVIAYFICMKLSLWVFHIDMASYSNANSVGLSTLLQVPKKFIQSYQLFYEMFFTNHMMKNTYLWNSFFYGLLGIIFVISLGMKVWKSKMKWQEKVLVGVLILLMPVFVNSVIFVISDAKVQLLMSASYLVFLVYMISFEYKKYLQIGMIGSLTILLGIYLVQVQASYLTLAETYQSYKTIIREAVLENQDKKVIAVGEIKNQDESLLKLNYGYISDDGIFWNEYHLRKLGFERFCSQAFGMTIEFGSEEDYNYVRGIPNQDVIYEYNDNIIINLSFVGGEDREENS